MRPQQPVTTTIPPSGIADISQTPASAGAHLAR
jgi:hypothetical protein